MKLLLPDVNVLLYAQREELPQHEVAKRWLEEAQQGSDCLVFVDHTLYGFLRIITSRRVFPKPTPFETAIDCVKGLVTAPSARHAPLPASHMQIFEQLCLDCKISGDDVSDANLAAAAISLDAEFISSDKGFRRFSKLRWTNPFQVTS